ERARAACAELGAQVVELTCPGELGVEDSSAIMFSEDAEYHARHAPALDRYRTSIRGFVELGRTFTDAAAYIRAQRRRAALTAEWERWFADHRADVVLEPDNKRHAPPPRGG